MTPKGLLAKDLAWEHRGWGRWALHLGRQVCTASQVQESSASRVRAAVPLKSIPGRGYEWRAGPWGALGRECVVSEGRVQS